MIGQRRRNRAYFAFIGHRLSGVVLAVFLPIHFLVLSEVLAGEAALDSVLAFAAHPLVKVVEWGLIVLLGLHFAFGIRLLVMEFVPWKSRDSDRRNWILPAFVLAVAVGIVCVAGAV